MVELEKLKENFCHQSVSEYEEEKTRTLYLRMPTKIKDVHEIKKLFFGNFKVKFLRQSRRYCYVIFSNVADKVKNMKAIKKNIINKKQIRVLSAEQIMVKKRNKVKQKKVIFPEPKPEPTVGKCLLITNLPTDVTLNEIKMSFPECVSIRFEGKKAMERKAQVKLPSFQLCSNYVQNKSKWPIIKGKKVSISYYLYQNIKKHKSKQKLKGLKTNNVSKELKKLINTNNSQLDEMDSEIRIEEKSEEDSSKNAYDCDSV